MAVDPFESGMLSGRAKAKSLKQKSEEDRKRYLDGVAKVCAMYEVLEPKFQPHGYIVSLDKSAGYLHITPVGYGSMDAPFEVRSSSHGPGYAVHSRWGGETNERHELDCSADRVIELAGEFFGGSIDYQKQVLGNRLGSEAKQSQQKGAKPEEKGARTALVVCGVIVVLLLLALL